MPDPVRSPSSIPTGALADALGVAAGMGHAMSSNAMLRILRTAEPKLYAHWAEQMVEKVREQGRADGTALRELVVDQMPPWAGLEDASDSEMADGVANWIASLLGLEDRT